MNKWDIGMKLMNCFPNSFINHNGEFIAHARSNTYFILENCETELEVKCKVLEWLSRAAHKTQPYTTKKSNQDFHKFMLGGINKFLGTDFNEKDMDLIYTHLGNCVNRNLTITFVLCEYNMDLLKDGER